MNLGSFLGGFLAVAVAIYIIYQIIRNKLRRFSRDVFGNPDLTEALKDIESVESQSPRSLNGLDSILKPQILKDFPDFDTDQAKSYARSYLQEHLGNHDSFTIHNIVISGYLRSGVQKTIIFQAAVSWTENDCTRQMRYELHYGYIVTGSTETVAANCPNCGGALGYGVTVCPYCESRVANVLGNCWQFTELRES